MKDEPITDNCSDELKEALEKARSDEGICFAKDAIKDQDVDSSNLLREFPRHEKDGKVAVLIFYGFGAGWSTWNDDKTGPLMMMHRDIVKAVLDKKPEKAGELAEKLVKDATGEDDKYVCVLGTDGLSVEWVSKGSRFGVEEYDGAESLHIIGERDYFSA